MHYRIGIAIVGLCLGVSPACAQDAADETLYFQIDQEFTNTDALNLGMKMGAIRGGGRHLINATAKEVIITVRRGTVAPADLVAAMAARNVKTSLQETDTWLLAATLDAKDPPDADRLRAALHAKGVKEVVVGAELAVTAYVPHTTTADLLASLAAAGVVAKAQAETLTLRVVPADARARLSAEDWSEVRRRLQATYGVVSVEVADLAVPNVLLTREKGRAGPERLARSLVDSGFSVEPVVK